ncbi:hypothetical protein GOC57_29760, partial [Sinorhizobium meliloti]|nr:hypothetical protein [Sinorhizobium meliloti]MDW9652462.1 hypothetical protein [Sinorhizobium meliloti]MDW9862871.1 hypothetical protein [Sinorhizobium meliloti]MDW9968004.1 hypothetical protein [Sinorhizobium meliloti]MDX0340287.1 hypothetical protein [Sinorhizobium meliloti]
NSIELPWSNGQAEGQINRLKMLKRAIYGRAGPELMRARMLPVNQENPIKSKAKKAIRKSVRM